ncbi:MAG: hypothetical protein HY066_08695 [Betaproteobacteria bacterium]|nr:hypothetical protein [Betaproteobacteria bacterium]
MQVFRYDRISIQKAILGWFCVAFLFLAVPIPATAGPDQLPQLAIQGHVDSFVVVGGEIVARGWAGPTDTDRKIASLSVWLGNTRVYEGAFERFERPDVVAATGRNDWLRSGWSIRVELPSNLKGGEYSVKVLAKLDDGNSVKLVLNKQVETIFLNGNFHQESRTIRGAKLALIVIFFLLCAVYLKADYLAHWIYFRTKYLIKPPVIFGLVLFLSFGTLVSLGVTGSSFGLGYQQTPFVQSDAINIWGKNRPIRSDEWLLLTPLAIAQYNHHPKFPVTNSNVGESGENMLIAGMVGVPVTHVSSIAKPATWGFFLFDLKSALSWYWCFPVFACLFALWGVVALLTPDNWKLSFLTALWFCASPYTIAWSNWPAYAVFFPSIALLTSIAILRTHDKFLLLVFAGILGIAIAGFVLLLYPPWQISLTYVFIALVAGIVVRDKLYLNLTKNRLASFGIAIIVAGFLLWRWWQDAHPAIQAILATVYPGNRSGITGGNVAFSDLLRGYTNLVTLYKLDSHAHTNQSEIASFPYMLLPLAVIFVLRAYPKMIGAVEIALASFMGFILYFMLVGVPLELAQFSLLGRVPPARADIGLGLAYIIICALLLSPDAKTIPGKTPTRVLALTIALIWTGIVFNSVSHLHQSVLAGSPSSLLVLPIVAVVLLIVIIGGYWLVLGKFRAFIYLNLAWSVITTLSFNPVNIAPNSVTAASPIKELLEQGARTLVLETQVPAMILLASGHAVANGIFYYPQKLLWERLDRDHTESNTYNRYQHLLFSGGVVENKDHYRIESPQADVVKVVIDLARFDFHKTGATLIAAPQNLASALRGNPGITYIKDEKGWAWFRISGGVNGK